MADRPTHASRANQNGREPAGTDTTPEMLDAWWDEFASIPAGARRNDGIQFPACNPATGDIRQEDDLMTTIREMHARGATPAPPAAFVSRLRSDLGLDASEQGPATIPRQNRPDRRTFDSGPSQPTSRVRCVAQGVWPRVEFLVAAAIVVALLTSLLGSRVAQSPTDPTATGASFAGAGTPVDGTPAVTNPDTGPVVGHEGGNTGEMPGPGPVGQPEVAWRVDTGPGSLAQPLYAQGLVMVAGTDGQLAAFDADTGAQHWRLQSGATLLGSPVTDGHFVYVVTAQIETSVFAFNVADGQLGWERTLPSREARRFAELLVIDDTLYIADSEVWPPQLVADGKRIAAAATAQSVVTALASDDGEEIWSVDFSSLPTIMATTENGVIAPELTVFAVFDRSDGSSEYVETSDKAIPRTNLVMRDDQIYRTGDESANEGISRVDQETGELTSIALDETNVFNSFAISNDRVVTGDSAVQSFSGDFSISVRAADQTSGEIVWDATVPQPGDGFGFYAPPVVADGVVYLGRTNGIVALDLQTGGRLWSLPTSASVFHPMVVVDERAFVLDASGILTAIGGDGTTVDPGENVAVVEVDFEPGDTVHPTSQVNLYEGVRPAPNEQPIVTVDVGQPFTITGPPNGVYWPVATAQGTTGYVWEGFLSPVGPPVQERAATPAATPRATPIALSSDATPSAAFSAGMLVTVNADGIILRPDAQARFERVGTIDRGQPLTITGGPVRVEGIDWWQVELTDGTRGWLPERSIERDVATPTP